MSQANGYEFSTDDLRHWQTMNHNDLEKSLHQRKQDFCLLPEKQEAAQNFKSTGLLKNGPTNERLLESVAKFQANAAHSFDTYTEDSLDKARILGTSSE